MRAANLPLAFVCLFVAERLREDDDDPTSENTNDWVTFSMLDKEMLSFLDCWADNYVKARAAQKGNFTDEFFYVCLDAEACEHLQNMAHQKKFGTAMVKIEQMIDDHPESESYDTHKETALTDTERRRLPGQRYMRTYHQKVQHVMQVENKSVLHADADAFWMRHPKPMLDRVIANYNGKVDIISSKCYDGSIPHTFEYDRMWGFGLNTGFTLYRNTQAVRSMLQELQNATSDQAALNIYVDKKGGCKFWERLDDDIWPIADATREAEKNRTEGWPNRTDWILERFPWKNEYMDDGVNNNVMNGLFVCQTRNITAVALDFNYVDRRSVRAWTKNDERIVVHMTRTKAMGELERLGFCGTTNAIATTTGRPARKIPEAPSPAPTPTPTPTPAPSPAPSMAPTPTPTPAPSSAPTVVFAGESDHVDDDGQEHHRRPGEHVLHASHQEAEPVGQRQATGGVEAA